MNYIAELATLGFTPVNLPELKSATDLAEEQGYKDALAGIYHMPHYSSAAMGDAYAKGQWRGKREKKLTSTNRDLNGKGIR